MTTILQVDDAGVLHVPAELLPQTAPHSHYQVSVEEGRLVIEPAASPVLPRGNVSSQKHAVDFLRWADTHKDGPGLPDHAVSREGIYEDWSGHSRDL